MHEDEVLFTEFFNQRLKEQGYTLKELSDETGISLKHLESFSHGRFELLPSAPYVHGYFVRLGAILGFDPDEWWRRIREEDLVHKAGARDRMPGNRFGRARGRILILAAVAIVFVGLYGAARYTTILGQPRLILTAPAADITTASGPVMTFEGTVENGDALKIDGNNVPLNEDGSFSTEVALTPGPNTVEVRAEKTLGRSVSLTRQIYYNAAPVIVPVAGTAPPPFASNTPSATPGRPTSSAAASPSPVPSPALPTPLR